MCIYIYIYILHKCVYLYLSLSLYIYIYIYMYIYIIVFSADRHHRRGHGDRRCPHEVAGKRQPDPGSPSTYVTCNTIYYTSLSLSIYIYIYMYIYIYIHNTIQYNTILYYTILHVRRETHDMLSKGYSRLIGCECLVWPAPGLR